jgi:RNA polymerase sigma-70 factor, ECF subfamily
MTATDVAETVDAAELLAQIAGGSEAALKLFYEAFHRRVFAFIQRRLNDPADAADVLNEVMLEIWRSAGRFEGRSQALTWVLGIAHHKALDALRRRGRHRTEELDESMPDEDCPSAGDVMNAAQNAELLRRCLDKLADTYKLVMHLAFFEDLPYPEIARIADCPVGTVKTRVFHAKRLLKDCLSIQMVSGDGNPSFAS